MSDQELQEYIVKQIDAGIDPEILRSALEGEGINKAKIKRLISEAQTSKTNVVESLAKPLPQADEPVVVVASAASSFEPKRSFNLGGIGKIFKHKIVWAAITVSLLLIGGGAYGYTILTLTPEKVAMRMLEEASDVQSMEFEGTVNIELTTATALMMDIEADSGDEQKAKTYKAEIKLSGVSDLSDKQNPKSSVNFNMTTEGMNFGFEIRSVDKVTYFKVVEFPLLGLIGGDTETVRDQWFKIDAESIKEMYGTSDEVEDLNLDTLSGEQLQKIQDLYVQYPIVNLIEKLAGEDIDGTGTHHYRFALNEENTKRFATETIKIIYPTNIEEYEQELSDGIGKLFEYLTIENSEIWIGKRDYLPRRVALTANIQGNEDETFDGSAKIGFLVNYKNYNKPTQIEAPQDVKSLNEIFEGAQGRSRDARRLADVRQIMTGLELYYNDNNGYPPALAGKPHPTQAPDGRRNAEYSFDDYIAEYPEYPTPSGQAPCDDNTSYVYSRPTRETYKLTFCLEGETGGLTPGDHFATEQGLWDGQAEPPISFD
ncbi:MAG TPA: hypothetical protein VD998_00895 [Verrucomicrobiae bacterium]|nr:hypothetical protein [Verrucomicrobiae bacterium]